MGGIISTVVRLVRGDENDHFRYFMSTSSLCSGIAKKNGLLCCFMFVSGLCSARSAKKVVSFVISYLCPGCALVVQSKEWLASSFPAHVQSMFW